MADRQHIPNETKLRLFSEAAGHCQHPACLKPLFPAEMGGDKHLAEMAHIVPHGQVGPRHQLRPVGDFEVDSFDNLILLCPTCHTTIDKNPEAYSRTMLISWKISHLSALAHKQGIRAYAIRSQVREAILAAMAENKAIWKEYAPFTGASFELNPESETAENWGQRMRSVLLPNHFRIQAIIKGNQHHITAKEQETFARYQEHVRGLSERHICGIAGTAIRFPQEMEEIFS